MKTRNIHTVEQLEKASKDLIGLKDVLPVVLTVSQGKHIRGDGANARYWVMLQESLDMITAEIDAMSEHTGYTPLEARKIIANEMSWEHSMILACRKTEPAHEVMKMICGIPTSTRLGTKEFAKFGDVIDMTMAQIVSEIRSICIGEQHE